MNRLMSWLDNRDLGLFLIRLGIACVFIYAGWVKFTDLENTVGFFGSVGLAPFFVYLVATVELLSGIAMLLGIFTRYAGVFLAIVMVFALILVKFEMGFAAYQIDLLLLLSSLGVAMIGPGRWSLSGFKG